jgi:hypothetical protein
MTRAHGIHGSCGRRGLILPLRSWGYGIHTSHQVSIVAQRGGWNCYYEPPGPKTMRAGRDKLAAMTAGFHILNP